MTGILGEEEAFAGFTGYGKNIPSDIPGLTEDQLYHPDGTTKNQFELDWTARCNIDDGQGGTRCETVWEVSERLSGRD